MSTKMFLKNIVYTYFIIVTLVVVATYVLGILFRPDQTFGYEAFLSPLIYGFFGILPTIVMYSKKELSIKQLIVRKILQLVILEVILMIVAFYDAGAFASNPGLLIGFGLSVLIIFVMTHIISFVLDCAQAKELNKSLLLFQEEEKETESDTNVTID